MTCAHGQIECLRYLHGIGCLWDDEAMKGAAFNGHLECLRFALDNGCGKSRLSCFAVESVCDYAATRGNLDCLILAHERGCPWDWEVCKLAAENGRLGCLQYAHENGCPWDEKVCMVAASGDSVECLKYAHENGFIYASYRRTAECLYFANGWETWVVPEGRPQKNRPVCYTYYILHVTFYTPQRSKHSERSRFLHTANSGL